MSSSRSNPIPQGIEKADKLVAGRSFTDISLFIGLPTAVGGILLYVDLIGALQFLVAEIVVFVLNGILFRLIPDEESVTLWVRGISHYLTTPSETGKRLDEASVEADSSLPYTPQLYPDGGTDEPTERDTYTETWWQQEDNSTVAGIKQVCPNKPILIRSDGVFVAAVEVTGRDISLASQAKTQSLIRQNASHLNNLDFDMTTYVTSDEFDIDGYIDSLESNLQRQAVKNRPILSELMASNINRLQSSSQQLGLKDRRTFNIITVDPDSDDTELNSTPFDFIEPDSLVGRLIGIQGSQQEEERRQMVRTENEVERRVESVMAGIGSVEGMSTERVGTDLLVKLVTSHFEKTPVSETTWQPQQNPLLERGQGTNIDSPEEIFSDT